MKASFPNHYVKWKECKVISELSQNYDAELSWGKPEGKKAKYLCKL